MVGAQGFEPWTSWSRTKRATRLRYAPPGRRVSAAPASPPAFSARISPVSLPQLFAALLPILTAVGFLLWYAFGLGAWQSLLAGLGMGALPIAIVAVLAWSERRDRKASPPDDPPV